MSKKDYEMLADVIRSHVERNESPSSVSTVMWLAEDIASELKKDNPRFDFARLLKACGQ